jgi:anti-anti-sigma regulatory factor
MVDFFYDNQYARSMSEFSYEKAIVGDTLILRGIGYLNEIAGQTLRAVVRECLSEGIRKVIVNLEKTTVINSPGITQILELGEEILSTPECRLALVGVAPLYQEVFVVTGIADQAAIFAEEKAALEQL